MVTTVSFIKLNEINEHSSLGRYFMLVYAYTNDVSRIELLVDVSTSDHHLRGSMILGSRNVETVQFLTDRPDNNASNSAILSSVSFRKPLILSKSV